MSNMSNESHAPSQQHAPRPTGRSTSHRAGLRAAAVVASGAAGIAGLGLIAGPAEAAGSSPYLFSAYAYGTSIEGGSLPASSGKTAYAVTGCTNLATRSGHNTVAGLDLSGLQVAGVGSSTASSHSSGAYASTAVNTIASVTVGQGLGPRLTITSLRAVSRSWHDARGYHARLSYGGVLAFSAVAGGPSVPVAFPGVGETTTVPGIGTVSGGTKRIGRGSTYASASGYSLKLHLDASDSTVRIGHTNSIIRKAVGAGVLGGRAFGSQISALGGVVTSGPTALKVLPCQGTDGRSRTNATAQSSVPGVLGVGVTESTVRGSKARNGVADSWTRSTVARVNLLGGRAVIRGVRAVAHVHRGAHGALHSDVRHTTAGTLTVGGRTTALPVRGSVTLPGVARIATKVVTRSRTSIGVVAVRVTLLSGTAAGSVVDLGNARARIARH